MLQNTISHHFNLRPPNTEKEFASVDSDSIRHGNGEDLFLSFLCGLFPPLYIIHWLSTTLTKKEKEDIQNGMIFACTEDQIVTLSQFFGIPV